MREVAPHIEEALAERLDRIEALLTAIAEGSVSANNVKSGNPAMRKYTAEEAGIRLKTGRDPHEMTDQERATAPRFCRSHVQRLAAAGVLDRIKVGRSACYTEAGIRKYEEAVAAGWVDGFRFTTTRYKK
jgi:hypothetical protein